jgi:serine O-acetyltransferase
VDLDHNLLPDPVTDMLAAMQTKIDELENKLNAMQKEVPPDEGIQYPEWKQRRVGTP